MENCAKRDKVLEYADYIRHLNNELAFKQGQRAELYELLTSITAPPSESVQKTADDKMSNLVSRYVDLSNEIINIYRQKFNAENHFQSLACKLPPQWERFLLLRYLDGLKIERIADEMGYSVQWCWKASREARAAMNFLIESESV